MNHLIKEVDRLFELKLVWPTSFHEVMVNMENNICGNWLIYTIFYYYCCVVALIYTPQFANAVILPFALPIALYLTQPNYFKSKNNLIIVGLCMTFATMVISAIQGCLGTYLITSFFAREFILTHAMMFEEVKHKTKQKEEEIGILEKNYN
ncbi:hypothetical protein QTN25_006428 [Entamoeba marina]